MIVTGHSLHVSVRNGCLVIKNGNSEQRIEKVPKIHERLVLVGNIGLVTLEAMAWLDDYGIAWSVISRDRGSIASNDDGRGDPAVWRSQITADPLPVIRYLASAKFRGQADIAELMRAPALAKHLRRYGEETAFADSLAQITGREGKAGQLYWLLWRDKVRVPFLADHMLKVPPRWIAYRQRDSLVKTNANRNATDPVNAMLNYAYKVAETLCVEACREAGMSPVLGMSHIRAYRRESDGITPKPGMALDLLEALRPACDRVVLDLLDYGQGIRPYLRWTDFLELDSGVVRVESAGLKRAIIEGCEAFRGDVSAYAYEVRGLLS